VSDLTTEGSNLGDLTEGNFFYFSFSSFFIPSFLHFLHFFHSCCAQAAQAFTFFLQQKKVNKKCRRCRKIPKYPTGYLKSGNSLRSDNPDFLTITVNLQ